MIDIQKEIKTLKQEIKTIRMELKRDFKQSVRVVVCEIMNEQREEIDELNYIG
jgi:hypothetical protein